MSNKKTGREHGTWECYVQNGCRLRECRIAYRSSLLSEGRHRGMHIFDQAHINDVLAAMAVEAANGLSRPLARTDNRFWLGSKLRDLYRAPGDQKSKLSMEICARLLEIVDADFVFDEEDYDLLRVRHIQNHAYRHGKAELLVS